YPVVTVTPLLDTICEFNTVQLSAGGASTYVWSPTSTLSCQTCNNPVASPATTTTYMVIGTNNGCSDTAESTITVLPKPNLTVSPTQNICLGNVTNLNVANASTYSWTPGNTLSCSNCPNPVASPTSTTTYTVIGTLGNGCSDTADVLVTVFPLPNLDAVPDREVCEGAPTQLLATGGDTYLWSPGTYLSCTACANPVSTPSQGITYVVEGTDGNGCKNKDTVTLTIAPHVPTGVGEADTICTGESTRLEAFCGVSYSWSPITGLSNPSSPNPFASPNETTTYTVLIQRNDCYVDTYKITLVVNPKPIVNAGPDLSIVAGESIKIMASVQNALGQTNFNWTPHDLLSCSDCLTPIATPL